MTATTKMYKNNVGTLSVLTSQEDITVTTDETTLAEWESTGLDKEIRIDLASAAGSSALSSLKLYVATPSGTYVLRESDADLSTAIAGLTPEVGTLSGNPLYTLVAEDKGWIHITIISTYGGKLTATVASGTATITVEFVKLAGE